MLIDLEQKTLVNGVIEYSILIGEQRKKIGHVTAKFNSLEKSTEISMYITCSDSNGDSYKGRGIGTRVLNIISSTLPKSFLKTKFSNKTAQKVAEKCGYYCTASEGEWLKYEKVNQVVDNLEFAIQFDNELHSEQNKVR